MNFKTETQEEDYYDYFLEEEYYISEALSWTLRKLNKNERQFCILPVFIDISNAGFGTVMAEVHVSDFNKICVVARVIQIQISENQERL